MLVASGNDRIHGFRARILEMVDSARTRVPSSVCRPYAELPSVHPARRVRRGSVNSLEDVDQMPLKVRELLALLEREGWMLVRTKGSHRQFRHASKPGTVTVAGRPNVDVPPGTLANVFRQAGLKK